MHYLSCIIFLLSLPFLFISPICHIFLPFVVYYFLMYYAVPHSSLYYLFYDSIVLVLLYVDPSLH